MGSVTRKRRLEAVTREMHGPRWGEVWIQTEDRQGYEPIRSDESSGERLTPDELEARKQIPGLVVFAFDFAPDREA